MLPVEMWKTLLPKLFSTFILRFPQHFPQPLWKIFSLFTTLSPVFHISTGPTTTTIYKYKVFN